MRSGTQLVQPQLPATPVAYLRYGVTHALSDAQHARNLAVLDEEEASRCRRFIAAEDRRDYAAAHALLRRTLSDAAPGVAPEAWRFHRTASGKPSLPPEVAGTPPLEFSLTHTRGLVGCIVCRGAVVGVDAEGQSRSDDLDLLLERVCSSDEREQLSALPPGERFMCFFDLWTLKEAYVKALGIGIGAALDRISFDLRPPRLIVPALPESPGRWWFALFASAGGRIAAAVACEHAEAPIVDATVALDGEWLPVDPVRTSAALAGR